MTYRDPQKFQAVIDYIQAHPGCTKAEILKNVGTPSSSFDYYINDAKKLSLVHVSGYNVAQKLYTYGPGEDAPRPGPKDGRARDRKRARKRVSTSAAPFTNVSAATFRWLYEGSNRQSD